MTLRITTPRNAATSVGRKRARTTGQNKIGSCWRWRKYSDRNFRKCWQCEITREAASELTTRLPRKYDLTFPAWHPHEDGFQVTVFYSPDSGLTPEIPIIPSDEVDVRQGTRHMIPVHLQLQGHLIRFVACHWTAFDNISSKVTRRRLADLLRANCDEFLHPAVPTLGVIRHVVILGDLNEEPTGDLFREWLLSYRDRESARSSHRQDREIRKLRLYNASWRLLGEQEPHGARGGIDGPAGTLYCDSEMPASFSPSSRFRAVRFRHGLTMKATSVAVAPTQSQRFLPFCFQPVSSACLIGA